MIFRRIFAGSLVIRAGLLAGLLLSLAPHAGAQGTPGPIAPKTGAQAQNPPGNAIRVQVQVATVPVIVHDSKGELVLNLEQKNFRVFDNDVEQKIESFDLAEEPLSAVLVFETSSRIAPLLPAIHKSGILFTQALVGSTGDAAILGYNDGVDNLLPFTADPDRIEKAIGTLKVGSDGTHLYDALSRAVGLLRNRAVNRRRAIIVVGESRDAGSQEKLGAVLREAQLSNIVIYAVGLSTTAAALRAQPKSSGPPQAAPPGTFGGPPIPGTAQTPTTAGGAANVDLLSMARTAVENSKAVVKERPFEIATTATGGIYQSSFRDHSIEDAVDAIGGDVNTQYLLSYRPTNSEGGFHKIRVLVDRPGMSVRTRPGYYLDAKN